MQLDNVKVGDTVVVKFCAGLATSNPKRRLATITKATPKQLWIGSQMWNREGRSRQSASTIRLPNDGEVAELERFAALTRQHRSAHQARMNEPIRKLASRLGTVDTEAWVALGMERLTQICGWLDEEPLCESVADAG